MVSFSDIIYHNLLKKAVIILVVIGAIIGVFLIYYVSNWMQEVEVITEVSITSCEEDIDCFEWCGECVSIRDARTCPQEFIVCNCIEGMCQQT